MSGPIQQLNQPEDRRKWKQKRENDWLWSASPSCIPGGGAFCPNKGPVPPGPQGVAMRCPGQRPSNNNRQGHPTPTPIRKISFKKSFKNNRNSKLPISWINFEKIDFFNQRVDLISNPFRRFLAHVCTLLSSLPKGGWNKLQVTGCLWLRWCPARHTPTWLFSHRQRSSSTEWDQWIKWDQSRQCRLL